MKLTEFLAVMTGDPNTLFWSGLFAALCLIAVLAYFHVMKPKAGTIEWIRLFGRKRAEPFSFCPLHRGDVLPFLLSFGVAWFLCGFRLIAHAKMGLLDPSGRDMVRTIFFGSCVTLVLAAVIYCFFRLFYGSKTVAALVTGLSSALCSHETYALILIFLSWICLYLWICYSNREFRRIYALLVLLSGLFYGIALMACWASFYLLPIYIAGYWVGKRCQWHRGDLEKRKGRLLLSLLMLVILLLVGTLFLWLLYYVFTSENTAFWTAALSGDTYHTILSTLLEKLTDITVPRSEGIRPMQTDLFTPILFVFSLIPTAHGAFVRRNNYARAALFCSVPFLAAWLIAGVDLMLAGSMPVIGWMLKGFVDRGRRRYAVYISIAVVFCYFGCLMLSQIQF